MSSAERPARTSPGLAATATTLMTLVAVAAGASSLRAAPVVLAQAEVVSSLGESRDVRSMAAVVAAVARDLLRGSSISAAIPPRLASDVAILPTRQITSGPDDGSSFSPLEVLNEHLLDLPPPAC